MIEEKRKRVRAIIFYEDNIISMYRERQGEFFYTFPGGGMEEGETEEDCVRREVFEEFGIIIEPIKKLYKYENNNNIEYFYFAKWVSGEFGSGEGEEFKQNQTNGTYIPKFIKISDIPQLPLMPPEVSLVF